MELEGVDLHVQEVFTRENISNNHHLVVGFEETFGASEREMWLNNHDQDDLLGVNDSSMFYADFPSLPDFPCMSSSSSSSPNPALPIKTTTCTTTTTSSSSSSSAAASWAALKSRQSSIRDSHLMGPREVVLKSDFEENHEQNNYHCYMQHQNHQKLHDFDDIGTANLSSTASMEVSQQHQNHDPGLDGTVRDCMDEVMGFGYMELFEGNDFFDAASILQSEENPLGVFTQDQMVPVPHQEEHQHQHAMVPQHHHSHHYQESTPLQHQGMTNEEENHHNQALMCPPTTTNDNEEIIQGEGGATGGGVDDEMSNVFLEWLKNNKDSVSASDLRSVKLKKATIESAARRLGGGKEAMKQLLKLILEWVQTSHLHNRRPKESNNNSDPFTHFQDHIQSQNRNNNCSNLKNNAPDQSNTCFNQTPWVSVSEQNYGTTTDQAPLMATPQPFAQQMVGAVSNNHNPYQPSAEYQMLDSTPSWPPSQFTTVANSQYNQSFGDNNLHTQKPSAVTAIDGYGNQYPYLFLPHSPGGDRLMRFGPSATREARKKRMARQRRLLAHHRHNHNDINQLLDSHARLGSDNCTAMLAPGHANQANWVYWQTMSGGAAPMAQVVPSEPPAVQQVVDWTAMQTQNTQNYHQGRATSEKRQQGWKPEKNLKFLLQKMIRGVKVRQQGTKPETKKTVKSQKNHHESNAATIAGAVINNNVTPSSLQQKNEKLVK
ncbi:unnamed protein product [Lupinus luteus]|uniref:Ig-like domain-containing protein n=1 Tax=Lupinus luteus TaxID=3873 RepID=A0AAV1W0I8_LUPLU